MKAGLSQLFDVRINVVTDPLCSCDHLVLLACPGAITTSGLEPFKIQTSNVIHRCNAGLGLEPQVLSNEKYGFPSLFWLYHQILAVGCLRRVGRELKSISADESSKVLYFSGTSKVLFNREKANSWRCHIC